MSQSTSVAQDSDDDADEDGEIPEEQEESDVVSDDCYIIPSKVMM